MCLKKGLSTYGSTLPVEYQSIIKYVHENVHDYLCKCIPNTMQLHSKQNRRHTFKVPPFKKGFSKKEKSSLICEYQK